MMCVEDRGMLFLEPGTEVYEGMIVGEHNARQRHHRQHLQRKGS